MLLLLNNMDELIEKGTSIHLCNTEDIPQIRALAKSIWLPTFQPILPPDRLQYLFRFMYDTDKLRTQLSSPDVLFYILQVSEEPVGYGQLIISTDSAKLEKLYIAPPHQGKGLGLFLLKFLVEKAVSREKKIIRLQVNRGNHKAVRFYERFGFKIIASKNFDVGDGHVMDDYVMEFIVGLANG